MPRKAYERNTRHFYWLHGMFVIVMVAMVLTACGGAGATGADQPYNAPAHWHDITPPTSDPIASYAVSPDVPGLIVACMGNRAGNQSDSPMGAATMWRTRDGGAHWQRLGVSGYSAQCEVDFPAGGHGALFALNLSGNEFIQVSHDEGDTWKTIASANGSSMNLFQNYMFMMAGAYRSGAFYTMRQSTGSNWAFAVSHDDGQTWTNVENLSDPLFGEGYTPLALAADDATPNGWFRLLGQGVGGGAGSRIVVEHSTDGGQTWKQVSMFGEQGGYFGFGGGVGSATLVTEPGRPLQLCAAISTIEDAPGMSAASSVRREGAKQIAFDGFSSFTPHDVTLASSDDGGHTWHATPVAQHQSTYAPVEPGVSMDASGACYVAVIESSSQDTAQDVTTIWRLAPTAGASPTAIEQITGKDVSMFAIGLDSVSHAPRFVAAADVYNGPAVIVCKQNSCPPSPPVPQSHLIWQPAP